MPRSYHDIHPKLRPLAWALEMIVLGLRRIIVPPIKKIAKAISKRRKRIWKRSPRYHIPVVAHECSWCGYQTIINSTYCPKCHHDQTGFFKDPDFDDPDTRPAGTTW